VCGSPPETILLKCYACLARSDKLPLASPRTLRAKVLADEKLALRDNAVVECEQLDTAGTAEVAVSANNAVLTARACELERDLAMERTLHTKRER
jgi:hypothetical protein